MNWDDVKVFLAIARSGSVRGAANALSVSHSTVLRRLDALE
ncbi:MAG: LysR family transcriptional regulator, partial [Pseudomonadota bacterium]